MLRRIAAWKYAIAVVVILGLSLYVSRQDQKTRDEYEKKCTQLNASMVAPPTHYEDCDKGAENAARHLPRRYRVFSWPEGITSWAILLTLLALAEQTNATRQAAEATKVSAVETMKAVKLQEGQLRQWVNTNDEWDVTCQTAPTRKTILTIVFGVINPTKMPLTLEAIRTIQGDDIRDESVRNVLLPEEGHEVKISKTLTDEELTIYKQRRLTLEFSLVIDFIDNCGDSFTQTLEYSCIPTLDGAKEIKLRKVERQHRNQQPQKAN